MEGKIVTKRTRKYVCVCVCVCVGRSKEHREPLLFVSSRLCVYVTMGLFLAFGTWPREKRVKKIKYKKSSVSLSLSLRTSLDLI